MSVSQGTVKVLDTIIYIPHIKARLGAAYKKQWRASKQIIPFSAFWLRSSVVSVLMYTSAFSYHFPACLTRQSEK